MPASPVSKPPLHIGWKIFWILFFLPAVLAVVSPLASTSSGATYYGGDGALLFFAALGLWPLCALYCGIWAGIRLGGRASTNTIFPIIAIQIILSILLSLAVATANFFITYVGCGIYVSLNYPY